MKISVTGITAYVRLSMSVLLSSKKTVTACRYSKGKGYPLEQSRAIGAENPLSLFRTISLSRYNHSSDEGRGKVCTENLFNED